VASAASADPRDGNQPFAISERPSAGLFLGVTNNGDSARGGGGGGEAGFVFDTPIAFGRRLRFDATRTSWNAKEDDGRGRVMAADGITLTTLRVSLASVIHHSAHVASYGALGLGAYRYGYARTPVTHHWHGGIHYLFGLEFLQRGGRSAVNAEVRIHAMGGPQVEPETQVLMFKLDAAVGMKLRF
jgi:hypothetical protein